MPLTRDFRELVAARVRKDSAFRQGLITEAVRVMLQGDLAIGRNILRDYINATVGFEKLARGVSISPKSLMRMFGPKGNPRADNLMAVIGYLQKATKVKLGVHAE